MRQRKSYGGSRHSAGLKDEFNDVFKSRAMEKKGTQARRLSDSAPVAESHQQQLPQPKVTKNRDAPKPNTNGVIKFAGDTRQPKKQKTDIFDLELSSDDEEDTRSHVVAPKLQKAPAKPSTKLSNGITNGHVSKSSGKNISKIITIPSDNSDDNSEPLATGQRSSTTLKSSKAQDTKKKAPQVPKRKARASSDSESEYRSVTTKKTKPSKPVVEKRKQSKVDVDDIVEKPAKRQDRTTTSDTAARLVNGKTKSAIAKSNTVAKPTKKPTRGNAESPDVEMATAEPVYDHAVDISYAPMSSPRVEKRKLPTLTREPSAVEMPSILTELIESRVAEIEEQQPAKKIKRPIKRPKQDQDAKEIQLLEIYTSDDVIAGSTGAKDAESQAQIQAAMYSADPGVRTTRSKFRNEGAAKKSYGVAQRTMRQPVTEEEQREDQKLEINRTLEMAAIKEYQKQQAEKKQQAAAAAAAESLKGGKKSGNGKAGEKQGAGKGKGKDKDSAKFDMSDDDGPKVMSRHALLQKGRHQRVLNEIDALMEDAEKQNPTRRSSILDIAHRMSNNTEDGKEFVQKFRLNSYDSKLLKNLDKEEDELTRIGYGWIIFILLNEELYSGRAIDLMLENGGFAMLKTMLTSDADLDELARSSALKYGFQIASVTGKLRTRLLQCRFIRADVPGPFSQRYVALMILNTMLKGVSKAEGRKLLLEQFDPRQFVEILSSLTRHVSPPNGPGLTNYFLSVSILSHYSQSAHIHMPLDELLEEGHLTVLSNALPTVLEWQVFDTTEHVDRVKDFQAAVLKLYIDRTNDEPAISTSVAEYRNGLALITETCIAKFKKFVVVADPEKDLSRDIDILVLTGILLGNLLEFSETARVFLRQQMAGKAPLIKSLMDIFVERHDRLALAESVEETHLNVAFGYLTVALAHACKNEEIRREVRSQLRGTLEPLVLAVTDFKVQNKTLEDAELAASSQDEFGEAASLVVSYTDRLEDILRELKAYGHR
ncbi:hypothetical protein Dda_0882 [Drechslerella dactyloides]|uniref:Wings apart-like protein C-terminal domain-containing protein n=1 Tax=Drechslerella dactyloides TaxID=74499 RepID=A0AAD6J8B5_DREDA|nr:hypothetical protein Dda_0882 [Drechslerella dactyloides]